ncbi:unnamed protein product, partial [Scytosiphon promiscuus]
MTVFFGGGALLGGFVPRCLRLVVSAVACWWQGRQVFVRRGRHRVGVWQPRLREVKCHVHLEELNLHFLRPDYLLFRRRTCRQQRRTQATGARTSLWGVSRFLESLSPKPSSYPQIPPSAGSRFLLIAAWLTTPTERTPHSSHALECTPVARRDIGDTR